MATHKLKTWPDPFNEVWQGRKLFEWRKDDRGFAVGDLVRLDEWSPDTGDYSGRIVMASITYILRGPAFDVPDGHAVLSLRLLDRVERGQDRGLPR
jgi:ParB family chromosome partitioning protein